MKTFSDYIEFKQIDPKPLRTIFSTSKPDELDVLERIMQLDPKRRPDASQVKAFLSKKKSSSEQFFFLDSPNGIFQ